MTNRLPAVDSVTGDFLSTLVLGALTKRYGTTLLSAANGVVGDGVVDDATALNTLLSSAAAFGAAVQLSPGAIVKVAGAQITVPSNTRLDLNGATLKNELASSTGRTLVISGVSNVVIYNGILDGDKASFAGVTEQRHNVYIVNSSNVTVRDIRSINAKGDGIYVGDNLSGLSSNITIENVTCDTNWRNGMSVSHVDGMEVSNSRFTNTAGTAPQAGVDIEPNDATILCQNIKFTNCHFLSNTGNGFQTVLKASPTARQGGIDLISCTFNSNTVDGISIDTSTSVRVIGGEARLNARGVRIVSSQTTISKTLKLEGMEISNNLQAGIQLVYGVDGLSIIGVSVRDNGQTTANTYNGIDLSPSVSSTNIRIVGSSSGGAQQKTGLVTTSNVSNLTLVGNDYVSNSTSATNLADDVTTRVAFDPTGSTLQSQLNLRQAGGTTVLQLWTTGDTVARLAERNDGHILWSSGSAAADVDMSRGGVGILTLAAANVFKTGQNVTGSRPAAATVGKGAQFYDTTLNLPIWSDGTNWKNAAGTTV